MNPEEFSGILKSLGIRQVCDGCSYEIDPTVCHCGVDRKSHDPFELGHSFWINNVVRGAALIVAAWGTHGSWMNQGPDITNFLNEYHLLCLGRNKDDSPKHPLYLPYERQLQDYKTN